MSKSYLVKTFHTTKWQNEQAQSFINEGEITI